MKKQILGLMVVLGLLGVGQAAVLDDAVSWMNTNGLTIFNNVTDYKPNNYIRRDEAAKLFVKFAKIVEKDTYKKTAEECKFSDLNDAHADLKDIVVESCRLGIFQGANGKFMPRNSITNEQAVAVLVRILVENQSETGVSYWSENYYKKANEMGMLSQVSMTDRKIAATRGNVGLVLATNSDDFSVSSVSTYEGESFSFQYPGDVIDGPRQDATYNNFIMTHEGGGELYGGEREFNVSMSSYSKKNCQKEIDNSNEYNKPSVSIINQKTVYISNLQSSYGVNGTILCFDDINNIATQIRISIDSSEHTLKNQIMSTLKFN